MPAIYTQEQLEAAILFDRKHQARLADLREFAAWNAALDIVDREVICRMPKEDKDRFNNQFYDGWSGAMETIRSQIKELIRTDYPGRD